MHFSKDFILYRVPNIFDFSKDTSHNKCTLSRHGNIVKILFLLKEKNTLKGFASAYYKTRNTGARNDGTQNTRGTTEQRNTTGTMETARNSGALR